VSDGPETPDDSDTVDGEAEELDVAPGDGHDEPTDPAGTRPKVDRDALLPARLARQPPPPEEEHEPAPLPEPVGAAGGPARLRERAEPPHAARFQFILGALIAIGAVSIVALIYAVGQSGPSSDFASSWSPWRPLDDGPDGAQEIAEHVGQQYRLSSGEQLVLATGGEPEVAGLPITFVQRETSGDLALVEGDGVLYRLCGLGPKCSIAKGKPSPSRLLLLRREALELALYSFRYLRGVDQVVVLMPPPPGKEPDEALFFRRGDVEASLQSPLRATLQAPVPTIKNVKKARDTPLVNRLTTRGLFKFSLTQGNQEAKVFLVLEQPAPATAGTGGSSGSKGSDGSSGSSDGTTTSPSGGLTATPSDPN
jgi:hypothetical protein